MQNYHSMNRRLPWLLLILLLPTGWWLHHRLAPRSRIVFVSMRSGREEIHAMNADGSEVKQLTGPNSPQAPVSDHYMPAVSPDGKSIAYIEDSSGPTQIWVMDADGQHKYPLRQHPVTNFPYRPTFSADGKQVYFFLSDMEPGVTAGIYRVGLDGSGERMISPHSHYPACSRAGNLLVYDYYRRGWNIFRADTDGNHKVQLTHNTNSQDPAISPDGKLIAFTSDRNGSPQLFLMDTNGSNVRQLTHESPSAGHPSFSPDGQQLAYDVGADYAADICTIHLDGRGRTALTHNHDPASLQTLLSHLGPLATWLHLNGPTCDWWPSWGPDPER